jgi:hypothetical protein
LIPPLLRQQLFRRYWIGQTVSLFGDQVTLIALPLVAVLVLLGALLGVFWLLPSPLPRLRELPEVAE